MKKNEILKGTISSIGYNGEGIVKSECGTVCFVPFALLNEEVSFKVLKANKNIAYCKLEKVLSSSKDRTEPLCPVFKKCGGCQLQHASYKEQLRIKSNIIKDCFYKIAGINVNVEPAVTSDNEYGYRNKIQFPIRNTKNGNVVGFFAENSHRIIDVNECPIQIDGAKDLIYCFKKFILDSGISCYNEETKKGLLRHVVARNIGNAISIIVVVNGKVLKHQETLVEILKSKFSEFSLFVNENTSDSNVILGSKYTKIYGSDYYYSQDFGIKYPVMCQSFMQVNNSVKQKLYSAVLNNACLNENAVVIDAYSGAGVMTAMLAKKANKAIGIEIVKEAVESANLLAKENGLEDKMTNICAPCEEVLPDIISKESLNSKEVVVVLDPPRKGCDTNVLNAILKEKPMRVIYVSCSPQTLARDIGILTNRLVYSGNQLVKNEGESIYKIESITPFDMFPHTKHIETLVCLCKKA
ncbi:MAG: 23S rRNA (uracil(1939)-C(5))-methyltransferase RlmD [Clostridia bacterium]|nr:23S rRNA (uracil(1939)-C(5))-methyltransferase RlmD [Clostridia bacterium]